MMLIGGPRARKGRQYPAEIVGTRTLLSEETKKPFSVFEIRVRATSAGAGAPTKTVLKRLENFVKLREDLLKAQYKVPAVPKERAHGNRSNFIKDMHACLQAWLKLLITDEVIAKSDVLSGFLNSSVKGLALESEAVRKDSGDEMGMTPVGSSGALSPGAGGARGGRGRGAEGSSIGLDDFTLLKVIGKGSFGKVMLVRKIDTRKVYAMKVLHKANVIKRNQVEHTRTERNVLEYIRHPFIVTLRYAFQTRMKLYFVLDYCPGGELFFHLGNAGRFDESRAKFYAAQITLALQYLHDLGIVYRDLKPENVLLDGDGNVALTDFGLSKEGINDNVSAHSFCGTPEYLAPEILTRSGHGRAADWWSLGALLYEMLTGMPPFYSRVRKRLFAKILKASLHLPRYFSPLAKSIVTGLLERKPENRLGSKDDAAGIKSHPFFKDIDWNLLFQKKLRPPFRPVVSNLATDTANFAAEFTTMPLSVDSKSSRLSGSGRAENFPNFTYVNDDALSEKVAEMKLTK